MSDDKTALPNELFLQETIRGQQLLLQELLLKELSAEAKKREDNAKSEEDDRNYIYETILNCADKEYKNTIIEVQKIQFEHIKHLLSVVFVVLGAMYTILNLNGGFLNFFKSSANKEFVSFFSVSYFSLSISIVASILVFFHALIALHLQIKNKSIDFEIGGVFNKYINNCEFRRVIVNKLITSSINHFDRDANQINLVKKQIYYSYVYFFISIISFFAGFLTLYLDFINFTAEDAKSVSKFVLSGIFCLGFGFVIREFQNFKKTK